MSLHIHRPRTIQARTVRVCPSCGERRRQVGILAVWYDALWTCCGCGDTYSVEGIHPRPFARGWREAERRRARLAWYRAIGLPAALAQLRRLTEAEIRAEVEPEELAGA